MGERLHRFISHPMVRGVGSVFTGNIGAQFLVVAATPVLTRLYGPDEFGVYGSMLTAISIASTAIGLGFNLAIPKARANEEAGALAVASTVSALFFAAPLGVLCYWAVSVGLWKLGAFGAGMASFVLVAGAIAFAFYGTALYAAIRVGRYRWIAIARITLYGGAVLMQIALAPLLGAAGLALGHVIGMAGGAAALAFLPQVKSLLGDFPRNASKFWLHLCANRDFFFYSMPNSVLSQVTWMIPVPLFAAMFDASSSGLVFMADRLVAGPAALIGGAVAQVFVGEAAKAARDDLSALRALYRKTLVGLFAFSIALMAALLVFATCFIDLLLGARWSAAAPFLVCAALAMPFTLAASPLTPFQLIDRQRVQFLWSFARLAAIVASIAGARVLGFGPLGSYACFAGCLAMCYLALLALWELELGRFIQRVSLVASKATPEQ
jgi:O-antigen/teichoic acid export membrane protein